MATYAVHLYPVVKVKIPEIEAESQAEAIKKADAIFEANTLYDFDDVELADEVSGYLVDEDADNDYQNSCWYEADGETKSNDADAKKTAIKELLELIARMNYDGEELADGEEFIMENDDAVSTLSELIAEARRIQTL